MRLLIAVLLFCCALYPACLQFIEKLGIGPFDVESCLIEHPAVAESGVVGKPDAERGEIVVAFVVLHPDFEPSADLVRELQVYTRERLSAHAYPREVVFVDELPKTASGKIQRYVLRERTK